MFFVSHYPRMNVHCDVTLEPEEYSTPFLLAVFSHVKCYISTSSKPTLPKCQSLLSSTQNPLPGSHTVNTFGERVDTVSGFVLDSALRGNAAAD